MRPVIFDIDRTLLDGMSGYLFAGYLMRKRAIPLAGYYRAARAMIRYRGGMAAELAIVEAGVTCYAGMTVSQVLDLARGAVREKMVDRLYVEAVETARKHIEAGDRVALATGSSIFIAQALAEYLGAFTGIGTDSLRDGDRLLPVMAVPPCMGEGKRELVRRWLEKEGFGFADALAYTDNGIDRPLLDVVGEAVAVNPDADLTRYAGERNLPVLHWTTPQNQNYQRTGTSWPLKD